MQLSKAILVWIIRRAFAFALIVLVLFGGYLLVTWAVPEFRTIADTGKQLEATREDRAAKEKELKDARNEYADHVAITLDGLVERTKENVASLGREVEKREKTVASRLEARCDEVARFWEDALGRFGVPKPCAAAEEAVQRAEVSRDRLKEVLNDAERQLETLQDPELTTDGKLETVGGSLDDIVDPLLKNRIADLKQDVDALEAEEVRLANVPDFWKWVWFVIEQWNERWMWLVGGALAILLAPPLARVFNYFVVMPLIDRVAKPVRLSVGEEAAGAQTIVGPAKRSLPINLTHGEVLSARAQHLRDVQGTVKGRLLYDWKAPFISFAAGLHGLSRVTPDHGVAQMTISDPEMSDSYLMRIDFRDHPGLAMHPRHVVGVIGAPRLKTRWHWGWHFLATGQARYILFTGTGSLLVQGIGDIIAPTTSAEKSKMEQNLVMGFDSRLTVDIRRTENFISYFQGKEPLVDKVFNGPYPYFWQKTDTEGTKNAIERWFEAVFSAAGKVLGF